MGNIKALATRPQKGNSLASEIVVEPPKPHGKKQHFIMSAHRLQGMREVWIAAGSKFGKTAGASVSLLSAGVERPRSRWRWVAPYYSQAEIGYNYMRSILPPEPYSDHNRSNLSLNLKSLDVQWRFWHATNPKALEGDAINGYVIDEAAKMSAEVRPAIRTTMNRTEGCAVFISTPVGRNWFYQGCMEAKEHMDWALAHGKPVEKVFIHARTIDNPYINPAVIENARKELPDRLFRQYYLAEFVDDGSVFGHFRENLFGHEVKIYGSNQIWFAQNAAEMTVVIGADWAKTYDYTVFTAFDVASNRLVGFQRFHKTPYTEAVRRLGYFSKRFKETLICHHDKTGVGGAIDDQLQYLPIPCQGITFNNANKSEMVARLITSFEHKLIALPRIPELIEELDCYEVSTNKLGLMSYSAPSGKHDDIVSSMLLSHAALLQYGDRSVHVATLEDMSKAPEAELSQVERFYRDIAEDAQEY